MTRDQFNQFGVQNPGAVNPSRFGGPLTATEACKPMRMGLEAELQRAYADLEKVNTRVREACGRAKRLADSCLGAVPENPGNPDPTGTCPGPGGFCQAVTSEINSIQYNLNDLEATLERLGV